MRSLIALGSIALGVYLLLSDKESKGTVWLPWSLIILVPALVWAT